MDYIYHVDIAELVADIAPDSIVSRTVHQGDGVKVILFGFDAGQELSEHTASVPAVLHFLEGKARLTLGTAQQEAGPGTWVHMAAKLSHSVYAETPVKMLLVMLIGN